MMRKWIAILLVLTCVFALAACSPKDMVQNAVRNALSGNEGSNAASVNTPAPASASVPTAAPGSSEGGGSSGGTSDGGGRPIASAGNPGGYWERLESEWQNAPEEGYVWTITIKGDQTVSIPMELGSVNYKLDFSCSHVGPDMLGVYKGSMGMEYSADLDNLMELLTMTGGTAVYDADGWFKNDAFLMNLGGYDAEAESAFVEMLEPENELTAEEQAMADAYMDSFLGDMKSEVRAFEESQMPEGNWFDWDFRMTEGDMSGYLSMTGIAYGTTSGSGSVDASGKAMQGGAITSAPLVGTFSERYSETLENPFPYIIRVYETGEAVMELHSANGGPVTVKFYGTIDKVRVEDTQRVP